MSPMQTTSQQTTPSPARHPAWDLFTRYKTIWQAAWAARHELAGPKRLADEAVRDGDDVDLAEDGQQQRNQEQGAKNPSRAAWGRVHGGVLQAEGRGQEGGRVIVSERSKTLQPLEASIVKQVLVKDGDVVQQGQVLIELDPTNASADSASVQEQFAAAESEALRTAALMEALRAGRAPVLPLSVRTEPSLSVHLEPHPSVRPELVEGSARTVSTQLQAEWQDITAKLAKFSAEHARRQAEMATVNASIAKLEATIPLARQREADVKGLADQGFMSGHASQDRARERLELERDLATQRARQAEAQAALHESVQAQAAYRAETQRTLSERQAQAHTKKEQLGQEKNKAQQRSRLTQLTAPTSGTVQQLAVHTAGGVVTPAQVLMVIVPKDAEVTAEVIVDNKGIGFVQAGQASTIKLETFPFTRYGTVQATVKSVAADAVADEKRGAIFPALLTLGSSHLDVDGKRIALSPGMNLSAEIKTGRRRIISYLFNPVQKTLNESLGER